jgi:electron transfer flavoprotein-quinone oxidoreductase
MSERFSAVVVGGGPAGLAAAMTLAQGGAKEVYVLERGDRCGAKNVFGGIFFTAPLSRLIPGIWDTDAPLERPVTRRTFSLLSAESGLEVTYRDAGFARPPHNHSFIVLRGKFDAWLAARAEKMGVNVITGVVAEGLVRDGKGRVIGVRTRVEEGRESAEGEMLAEVVILAEGANAIIAEREGLRPKFLATDMAVGVKEVIALPPGMVQERFALGPHEGEAREYFGDAVRGLVGSGFLYTNRDSVSVGVGAGIREIADLGMTPNQLLDRFKSHPCVAPYLEGGETVEYSAHMIPEAGYNKMGRLCDDGVMVVGDAGGLVNVSPYHEGTNLAVMSGILAGETALEALERKDASAAVLALYRQRLEESFVLRDIRKFTDLPAFMRENPQLLTRWNDAIHEAARDLFTVSETPKQEQEDRALEKFFRKVGWMDFVTTMVGFRNALNIYPLDPIGQARKLLGGLLPGILSSAGPPGGPGGGPGGGQAGGRQGSPGPGGAQSGSPGGHRPGGMGPGRPGGAR